MSELHSKKTRTALPKTSASVPSGTEKYTRSKAVSAIFISFLFWRICDLVKKRFRFTLSTRILMHKDKLFHFLRSGIKIRS